MSNNSQWNSFQTPALNSDVRLYQYQTLFAKKNLPRPTPHLGSPASNMLPFSYSSSQPKRPNGLFGEMESNTFSVGKLDPISSFDKSSPIGNFPPIGVFNADMFNEKSNSSVNSNRNNFMSGDTSNNQGTRETGIIEKLLVSSRCSVYDYFYELCSSVIFINVRKRVELYQFLSGMQSLWEIPPPL
jgi:hypothetical protein